MTLTQKADATLEATLTTQEGVSPKIIPMKVLLDFIEAKDGVKVKVVYNTKGPDAMLAIIREDIELGDFYYRLNGDPNIVITDSQGNDLDNKESLACIEFLSNLEGGNFSVDTLHNGQFVTFSGQQTTEEIEELTTQAVQ